jgi:hypothetical protein
MRNAWRASSPRPRSLSSAADLRSSRHTFSALAPTSNVAGSTFRRISRTIRTDPSRFSSQHGDTIAVDGRSVRHASDMTATPGDSR